MNGIRSTEASTRGPARRGETNRRFDAGGLQYDAWRCAKLRDPPPLKSRIKNLDCHQIQLLRFVESHRGISDPIGLGLKHPERGDGPTR